MKVFTFPLIAIFLFSINISTAQELISGTIIDAEGESVFGANVRFEKSDQFNGGTSTDFNGNFIMKTEMADFIVISYLGYTDFKCSIEDLIFDNLIMLESAIHELEIVVVTPSSEWYSRKSRIVCGYTIMPTEKREPVYVNELPAKIEWSTYPNPTTDFLEIKSVDSEVFGTIELFDQHGRMVQQSEYRNSTIRINLSELLPGQYYARFSNSELTGFVGKVVKIDAM